MERTIHVFFALIDLCFPNEVVNAHKCQIRDLSSHPRGNGMPWTQGAFGTRQLTLFYLLTVLLARFRLPAAFSGGFWRLAGRNNCSTASVPLTLQLSV